MNLTKYFAIGLLFLGMTVLVGCKKEVKINKNLWKNCGEWNIEKFQNNYSFGGASESYIVNDAGTFKFDKDGTGKLTLNDAGQTYTNLFSYENTDNSLTLTYKEGQLYTEGTKEKYTLDWEKDKINLYSYVSDAIGYDEYIIDLKKK